MSYQDELILRHSMNKRVEGLWQFIEMWLTSKPYAVVITVNSQN